MQDAGYWEAFWNDFPRHFNRDDFLRQVSKTSHGRPISIEQVDRIVADVVDRLALQPSDRVLDVCCGNGVLTSRIAPACHRLLGVDYSVPLIEIAREHHALPNVEYQCRSALELNRPALRPGVLFDKIYMYEALQHFQEHQFAPLLENLLALSSPHVVILLASIPHHAKLGRFYDTPERRRQYRKTRQEGGAGIGTWWKMDRIRRMAADLDLRCEFLHQPETFHTAHYRFDVRIKRN